MEKIGAKSPRVHRLASVKVNNDGASKDNIASSVVIVLVQAAVIGACSQFTYAPTIHAMEYGLFRDVSLMIFFGFGFLMTFLKRHGLSAIGYCLVLSALVAEVSIPVEYLLNKGNEATTAFASGCTYCEDKYMITIENLMNCLFCAGAVMISYGAVIGKVTPFQLIIMAIVEVFAFWLNFRLAVTEVKAHDVGGGMVIHTFGAYFGLAATFWVTKPATKDNEEEGSIYSSDIFSLAGTIFLWVLWPSFQSAVAGSPQRQYLAQANTFLSLCGSTLGFATVSRFLNRNKFDVVHMQNATLAGGVVMGCIGDVDIGLHGAMGCGYIAGVLSCVGYSKVMPLLVKCNIHDTCGVNNLHGMPGILSAIIAIFVSLKYDNGKKAGPTEFFKDDDGNGIGADKQALALLITLGVALGCGTLAGILMKVVDKVGIRLPDQEYYNDRLYFGGAADYEAATSTDKSLENAA